MRLSIDANDIGYSPNAIYASVYLDETKVKDCITADEEKGIITRYARDRKGTLRFGAEGLIKETVTGKVKIVLEM